MKKLVFFAILASILVAPKAARAETQYEICPQPYGGAVVCGVHTPVETGIAENIPLIGSAILGSSGIFFYLSKRVKKNGFNQNS